jgi:carbamoyl-phosphate synthase large subunit
MLKIDPFTLLKRKYLNNQNKTILVLGISGNVSTGILRVLRRNFPSHRILAACVNDTHSKIYSDEFVISPYANDTNFLDWIIDISLKYDVDIIYTGVEEIINILSNNRKSIEENTKSILAISRAEVLEICLSKLQTVSWLRENKFNYPKFSIISNKPELIQFFNGVGADCILKPISGKGSKNLYLIRSINDIMEVDEDNLSLMIAQEYIGKESEEYTVGCYQTQGGKVVTPIILRRTLNNGNTETAEIIRNEKIESYCIEITQKLKPFGPINIQLRLNECNEPVCFEINPRFSGTTLIRDYFGFKDVVSFLNETLYDTFNEDHFKISNTGYCIRRTEEFFFDSKELISTNNLQKYEA